MEDGGRATVHGAYGAPNAGGTFDLERFLRQPQTVTRIVSSGSSPAAVPWEVADTPSKDRGKSWDEFPPTSDFNSPPKDRRKVPDPTLLNPTAEFNPLPKDRGKPHKPIRPAPAEEFITPPQDCGKQLDAFLLASGTGLALPPRHQEDPWDWGPVRHKGQDDSEGNLNIPAFLLQCEERPSVGDRSERDSPEPVVQQLDQPPPGFPISLALSGLEYQKPIVSEALGPASDVCRGEGPGSPESHPSLVSGWTSRTDDSEECSGAPTIHRSSREVAPKDDIMPTNHHVAQHSTQGTPASKPRDGKDSATSEDCFRTLGAPGDKEPTEREMQPFAGHVSTTDTLKVHIEGCSMPASSRVHDGDADPPGRAPGDLLQRSEQLSGKEQPAQAAPRDYGATPSPGGSSKATADLGGAQDGEKGQVSHKSPGALIGYQTTAGSAGEGQAPLERLARLGDDNLCKEGAGAARDLKPGLLLQVDDETMKEAPSPSPRPRAEHALEEETTEKAPPMRPRPLQPHLEHDPGDVMTENPLKDFTLRPRPQPRHTEHVTAEVMTENQRSAPLPETGLLPQAADARVAKAKRENPIESLALKNCSPLHSKYVPEEVKVGEPAESALQRLGPTLHSEDTPEGERKEKQMETLAERPGPVSNPVELCGKVEISQFPKETVPSGQDVEGDNARNAKPGKLMYILDKPLGGEDAPVHSEPLRVSLEEQDSTFVGLPCTSLASDKSLFGEHKFQQIAARAACDAQSNNDIKFTPEEEALVLKSPTHVQKSPHDCSVPMEEKPVSEGEICSAEEPQPTPFSSNLFQPVSDAHQPMTNLLHQVSDSHQTMSNILQPQSDPHEPMFNLLQQVSDPHQPMSNLLQPMSSPHRPMSNLLQPVSDPHQPMTNLLQPVSDPNQPMSNLFQPVSDPHQPMSNLLQPVSDPHQPMSNLLQPVSDPHQPMTNLLQPVSDPHQPMSNLLQPVSDPHQPMFNLLQPVSDLHQPMTNLLQPASDPHRPMTNLLQPVTDPHQPMSNLLQPVTGPHQPMSNLFKPVSDPHQPMSNLLQPMSDLHQPMTNLLQQVSDPNQSVFNLLQPVSDPHQPMFNLLQPVSDPHQPMFNLLQPVSGPHQPVFNLLQSLSDQQQPESAPGQPVLDTHQQVSDRHQPVSSLGQTVSASGKPVPDTHQPVSAAGQPMSVSGQPVSDPPQSVSALCQPVSVAHQPVSSASGQPVPDPHQPVSAEDQPVSDPPQPVSALRQPVSSFHQPVPAPCRSISIPCQPVSIPGQATSDPQQSESNPHAPASDPFQHASDICQPVFNLGQPVSVPCQPASDPPQPEYRKAREHWHSDPSVTGPERTEDNQHATASQLYPPTGEALELVITSGTQEPPEKGCIMPLVRYPPSGEGQASDNTGSGLHPMSGEGQPMASELQPSLKSRRTTPSGLHTTSGEQHVITSGLHLPSGEGHTKASDLHTLSGEVKARATGLHSASGEELSIASVLHTSSTKGHAMIPEPQLLLEEELTVTSGLHLSSEDEHAAALGPHSLSEEGHAMVSVLNNPSREDNSKILQSASGEKEAAPSGLHSLSGEVSVTISGLQLSSGKVGIADSKQLMADSVELTCSDQVLAADEKLSTAHGGLFRDKMCLPGVRDTVAGQMAAALEDRSTEPAERQKGSGERKAVTKEKSVVVEEMSKMRGERDKSSEERGKVLGKTYTVPQTMDSVSGEKDTVQYTALCQDTVLGQGTSLRQDPTLGHDIDLGQSSVLVQDAVLGHNTVLGQDLLVRHGTAPLYSDSCRKLPVLEAGDSEDKTSLSSMDSMASTPSGGFISGVSQIPISEMPLSSTCCVSLPQPAPDAANPVVVWMGNTSPEMVGDDIPKSSMSQQDLQSQHVMITQHTGAPCANQHQGDLEDHVEPFKTLEALASRRTYELPTSSSGKSTATGPQAMPPNVPPTNSSGDVSQQSEIKVQRGASREEDGLPITPHPLDSGLDVEITRPLLRNSSNEDYAIHISSGMTGETDPEIPESFSAPLVEDRGTLSKNVTPRLHSDSSLGTEQVLNAQGIPPASYKDKLLTPHQDNQPQRGPQSKPPGEGDPSALLEPNVCNLQQDIKLQGDHGSDTSIHRELAASTKATDPLGYGQGSQQEGHLRCDTTVQGNPSVPSELMVYEKRSKGAQASVAVDHGELIASTEPTVFLDLSADNQPKGNHEGDATIKEDPLAPSKNLIVREHSVDGFCQERNSSAISVHGNECGSLLGEVSRTMCDPVSRDGSHLGEFVKSSPVDRSKFGVVELMQQISSAGPMGDISEVSMGLSGEGSLSDIHDILPSKGTTETKNHITCDLGLNQQKVPVVTGIEKISEPHSEHKSPGLSSSRLQPVWELTGLFTSSKREGGFRGPTEDTLRARHNVDLAAFTGHMESIFFPGKENTHLNKANQESWKMPQRTSEAHAQDPRSNKSSFDDGLQDSKGLLIPALKKAFPEDHTLLKSLDYNATNIISGDSRDFNVIKEVQSSTYTAPENTVPNTSTQRPPAPMLFQQTLNDGKLETAGETKPQETLAYEQPLFLQDALSFLSLAPSVDGGNHKSMDKAAEALSSSNIKSKAPGQVTVLSEKRESEERFTGSNGTTPQFASVGQAEYVGQSEILSLNPLQSFLGYSEAISDSDIFGSTHLLSICPVLQKDDGPPPSSQTEQQKGEIFTCDSSGFEDDFGPALLSFPSNRQLEEGLPGKGDVSTEVDFGGIPDVMLLEKDCVVQPTEIFPPMERTDDYPESRGSCTTEHEGPIDEDSTSPIGGVILATQRDVGNHILGTPLGCRVKTSQEGENRLGAQRGEEDSILDVLRDKQTEPGPKGDGIPSTLRYCAEGDSAEVEFTLSTLRDEYKSIQGPMGVTRAEDHSKSVSNSLFITETDTSYRTDLQDDCTKMEEASSRLLAILGSGNDEAHLRMDSLDSAKGSSREMEDIRQVTEAPPCSEVQHILAMGVAGELKSDLLLSPCEEKLLPKLPDLGLPGAVEDHAEVLNVKREEVPSHYPLDVISLAPVENSEDAHPPLDVGVSLAPAEAVESLAQLLDTKREEAASPYLLDAGFNLRPAGVVEHPAEVQDGEREKAFIPHSQDSNFSLALPEILQGPDELQDSEREKAFIPHSQDSDFSLPLFESLQGPAALQDGKREVAPSAHPVDSGFSVTPADTVERSAEVPKNLCVELPGFPPLDLFLSSESAVPGLSPLDLCLSSESAVPGLSPLDLCLSSESAVPGLSPLDLCLSSESAVPGLSPLDLCLSSESATVVEGLVQLSKGGCEEEPPPPQFNLGFSLALSESAEESHGVVKCKEVPNPCPLDLGVSLAPSEDLSGCPEAHEDGCEAEPFLHPADIGLSLTLPHEVQDHERDEAPHASPLSLSQSSTAADRLEEVQNTIQRRCLCK